MGLFSFRPKWEKLAQKAEKAASARLWADALALYEDARDLAPEGERDTLAEHVTRCRSALFAMHREAAEELSHNRDFDASEQRWRLAEQFATADAEREQATNAIRELARRRVALEEAAWAEEEPEPAEVPEGAAVQTVSDDDAFLMIAGQHPEHIADAYQDRDQGFREAVLRRVEGDLDFAARVLGEAARDRGDALAAFEFGLCLRAQKRDEEAVEHLARALELEPDWIDAALALVQAAWALERWSLAEDTLQAAMDRSDDVDPRVYVAVVQTAVLTEQPEYGLEAAEEILERAPNERAVLVMKGQLLEQQGKTDAALALYERVVQATWQYDPDEGGVLFDVAAGTLAVRAYLRLRRDLERAEELVRAALTVTAPAQRWAYELILGEVLLAAGRDEEGREVVEGASRLVPDDEPVARMRAAELLGDDATVAALERGLSDAQRRRWERRVRSESRG
jgi:tetratricopeptide (TPR) repeat protein